MNKEELIEIIESKPNDYELGIHKYRSIMDYNSGGVDKKNITRKKGFFGRNDYNIFILTLDVRLWYKLVLLYKKYVIVCNHRTHVKH